MQEFRSVVSLTLRLGITYVEEVGRCDSSKINFVKQSSRLSIKQLQFKTESYFQCHAEKFNFLPTESLFEVLDAYI